MTAIAWTDVVDVAASLSTVDTDAQTIYLGIANTMIEPELFGGESAAALKLARVYVAAHFAEVARQAAAGAAGPIASESGGGLSVSYAAAAALPASAFDATGYGRAYRALLRMVGAGAPRLISG